MSLIIKPEGIELSLIRPLSMDQERVLLTSPIDFNIYLGVALKTLREAAIYSIKHITDITLFAGSMLRNIEAGTRAVKPNELYILSKLYGCEVHQVMFLAEYFQKNSMHNYSFVTSNFKDLLT